MDERRAKELLKAEYRKLGADHYAAMVDAGEPPVQVIAAVAAIMAAASYPHCDEVF